MTDYILVPVEPTAEMAEAYQKASSWTAPLSSRGYKAMLAAAPVVQGESVKLKAFSKGDTYPVGDCGNFVSGINHSNMLTNIGQWDHQIEVYGNTPEQAEALRDHILGALEASAMQVEPECGCCGQTVKCDDDCDAVVIGGNKLAPDELSDYDRGIRDGKLDRLIDEVVAESALVEALEQIRAIEDELYGGDWDEIEKARNIANEALAAHRKVGDQQ